MQMSVSCEIGSIDKINVVIPGDKTVEPFLMINSGHDYVFFSGGLDDMLAFADKIKEAVGAARSA